MDPETDKEAAFNEEGKARLPAEAKILFPGPLARAIMLRPVGAEKNQCQHYRDQK